MSVWDFDKEVANEFNNKYKITMKKIKVNELELYQFSITDSDFDISTILFTKTENDFFEPYIYNYKEHENGQQTGSIITKGTCYYDWLMTVRKVFGRYNKKKKAYENGSLYVVQFIITFCVLDNILNGTGKCLQLLGTRQFGKTELMITLDAFIPIFMPKYVTINNDMFWCIYSSYTDISVTELFTKFKTKVKKVLEIHSELYPNEKIVYGREAIKYYPHTSLDDNKEKMEFKLLVGEKLESYSVCYAIPAGVIRDGKMQKCCQ